jgi:hypothetical protein
VKEALAIGPHELDDRSDTSDTQLIHALHLRKKLSEGTELININLHKQHLPCKRAELE